MMPDRARKFNNSMQKPMLYLVNSRRTGSSDKHMLYDSSGPFYVMVIIILFACLGLLLNIGLKVQDINYQKDIFKLNQMIAIEEDRSDRLKLEISQLKSPSRILTAADEELHMKAEGPLEVVGISGENIVNNEKIFDYISREDTADIPGNYDNLLGTIYYFQDIILVVSESVLTFFIP
jgi:cell division protein FtsL